MSTQRTEPSGPLTDYKNIFAPGVPFYTPVQSPPSGTAFSDSGNALPKVFQPLTIRGVTLQNRIVLSPLAQYSAQDGHITMWHLAHLGGIIMRGPGLSIIEATAVTPEGRMTPQDCGLWKDSQIAPLKQITDFAHSQGQTIGIQLSHAGRKASMVAPWLGEHLASEKVEGWPKDVWAPSPIAWSQEYATPKALTREGIEDLKESWGAAVKRAVQAGFDVIEIGAAHGHLLHQFLSPATNKRTDEFGGSFENRTRLTLQIVGEARSIIPDGMPLFLRISATDWLEDVEGFGSEASWTCNDTARLGPILAKLGVDLVDVSISGQNHPKQLPKKEPGGQARLAMVIKKAAGDSLAVSTVGGIDSAKEANDFLDGGLDVVMVGRGFLRRPNLVAEWAGELGVKVHRAKQLLRD